MSGREQILLAATRAFARAGFAATGLDDIAAVACAGRVISYRHLESKAELYGSVRAECRIASVAATGAPSSPLGYAARWLLGGYFVAGRGVGSPSRCAPS